MSISWSQHLATARSVTPVAVARAGTYVVYVSAVLSSMAALYGLALTYAGFTPWSAPLFAVTLDIYWLRALQVVMDNSVRGWNRVLGAFHTITAIGLSVAGNVAYHELHAGMWHLNPGNGALVTAVLSSLAMLELAGIKHLWVLARPGQPPQGNRPRANHPRAATAPANRPAVSRETTPANHPSQPPQQTEPPQPTTPVRPTTPPHGETAPRELTAGSRPDPAVIEKAWELLRTERIFSRRSLTAAVNEHYGRPVIGESAAARAIAEYDAQRQAG